MDRKRVLLTGVQPTGDIHLGNYVGAIRPLVEMSQNHETFCFIADYHSLNSLVGGDLSTGGLGEDIYERTLRIAAAYMALGINHRAHIYRQSDIPEIFEIETLISNFTPKGLMNRSHAYKSKIDEICDDLYDKYRDTFIRQTKVTAPSELIPTIDKFLGSRDSGINMGLYNYPLLMASDILGIYPDVVPIGEDQRQHLEITRSIIETLNHRMGEEITIPSPLTPGGSVPGLDGRKMSKSYNNYIPLFGDLGLIHKKIFSIKTSSASIEDKKNPDKCLLFKIFSSFASDDSIAMLRDMYVTGGVGYGDMKKCVRDEFEKVFAGPGEEYERLMASSCEIEDRLSRGAEAARERASSVLDILKKNLIFLF